VIDIGHLTPSLDFVAARSHRVAMDVDEVVEALSAFLRGMADGHPDMAAELRRIEIDLDAQGVLRITTDVGAGWAAMRPAPPPKSETAVHVDVAVMANYLGVDNTRWCHGTVDTDCLLQVLAEDSLAGATWSGPLGEVFESLSVDPQRLLAELARARPEGRSGFPVSVPNGHGGWVGQHQPTGRFVLALHRVLHSKRPGSDESATPVETLQSLLMEDQGPAAEALEALGVSPRAAREILGLAEGRPVQGGTMWPPAPHPREFSRPDGRRGPLAQPESPPPSRGTTPSSFVWTSPSGQELEMSAVRNGPIRLRARADAEVTVDFDAHTAEILARHLMDFYHQLEIERWDPIYDAEAQGRPKPPPPRSL
jgi:hypothetical protein